MRAMKGPYSSLVHSALRALSSTIVSGSRPLVSKPALAASNAYFSISGVSPVEPTPDCGGRPVSLCAASSLSGVLDCSTAPFLPTVTMPKLGAKDGAGNTLLMLVAPPPPGKARSVRRRWGRGR